MDAHIVCLGETHLRNNDEIHIDGFKFIGHNRKCTHVNALRGSGGVAFLISEAFLNYYTYKIVDKSKNDLLAVKFIDKLCTYSFLVINGYLPPENSVWGRDATDFMAHVLSLVYSNSECDMVFFVGDVNARVGNLTDYIDGIDDVPSRKFLDLQKNSHGDAFIDLLLESKMCVLNGRITADLDNFTSVSTKGSSVVDYIAINHNAITKCKQFKVHLAREAMSNANVYHNKIPDHSVLELVFDTNNCYQLNEQTSLMSNCQTSNENTTRFRVKADKVTNLFNCDLSRTTLLQCIQSIEQLRLSQESLDDTYRSLCDMYYAEMGRIFGKYNSGKYKNYAKKFSKPFWTQHLSTLWKNARDAESKYLKLSQRSRLRRVLRAQYYEAQKLFDSEYSKAKRRHQREQLIKIESINTNNPREFWNAIKNLGPKKKCDIPIETYDDLGNVITDQEQVLHTWSKQFSDLYKGYDRNDFDNEFYQRLLTETAQLEAASSNESNVANDWYNRNIEYEEVKKVINKAKLRKAVGIDCLPYEIFKHDDSINLLWVLFRKIFSSEMIPNIWRLSMIKPIPKNAHIDPRCPLQYRGIALLSNVYKLYANVLNHRISSHVEENVLNEEQNGFRTQRSCADHLYTLTGIIRMR